MPVPQTALALDDSWRRFLVGRSPAMERLAEKIDETIERDAVVNAGLATVRSFIETATSVRDLVQASTAPV